MFIAALHNGISRLYETFGNGGADTVERELRPDEYARTWYKQNPPLPKTMWSQRNNNNYEQTGLLTSLHYFAANGSCSCATSTRRASARSSRRRPKGPAAYVLTRRRDAAGRAGRAAADAAEAGRRDLARDGGVHGHRAGQESPGAARHATTTDGGRGSAGRAGRAGRARRMRAGTGRADRNAPPAPVSRTFPAGSYIVRMDQPYSRIADSLLDYQYWSPNDPQKTPYDDTGWTFPELFNVQAIARHRREGARRAGREGHRRGAREGRRHRAPDRSSSSTTTPTSRSRRCATGSRTRRSKRPRSRSTPAARKFNRGSFIIKNADAGDIQKAATDLGLQIVAVSAAPSVKTHPVRAPRVAHAAHLAQHADRRLVAPGVRRRAGAVHLHQHAADRQRRQPQREVRRHRVSAGRPRTRRDRQRHADVGQRAAVEEDGGDAEPRLRGSDRRHASGPRLHRRRATCRRSCARADCSSR